MKILMHMCCAPCAVYPLSVFEKEETEITGYFYNPNIHPIEEFEHRRDTVKQLADLKKLTVYYEDDFEENRWRCFGGSNEERCSMCYSLRLERCASFAKSHGFDAFTTSLLVSPYQKHDLIKMLGEKYAKQYGIKFYYRDFREGFREGQAMAKDLGLYRQKYCGCIISYNERLSKLK